MKNKITCLLAGAALFGATANAEIAIGDSLSAYGYIDMALTDGDGAGNTETAVAEFELGFSFAPAESAWSAVAELSFDSDTAVDGEAASAEDAVTDSSAEFETVTITYAASDSLSYTFGNILSYQGFETYDATGLYQFSYAGTGIGDYNGGSGALYSAGYAVGACADYSTGDFDLGIWVGDTTSSDLSYEYLVAYNGIENLTLKFIYADDPGYETTNIWASYDYGDFTFAVETVQTDEGTTEVVDVDMFMVYYAMGDAGITVRYSDGEYGANDFDKFTVSPSYAFSDNVFGLVEFSSEDYGTQSADTAAVELIYSF
jgi:hypothetical protein